MHATPNFSFAVTVADNSTTEFYAVVTDVAGNRSACSITPLVYAEDSTPPSSPALSGTLPSNLPNNDNSPEIIGATTPGSTVRVFTNPMCSGVVAGTGVADMSGAFSVTVNVAPNSTTTFFANAIDTSGNVSGCSVSGVTYIHTTCVITDANDQPDDLFTDSNCDGIDGNVSQAIFCRCRRQRCRSRNNDGSLVTINAGIAKALANSKSQVLVSNGIYLGRVTLVQSISLFGKYAQSSNWQRSNSHISTLRNNSPLSGRLSAIEGVNIVGATTVDGFHIETGAVSTAQMSNYGVICNNCGGLRLNGNSISVGNGGAGLNGSDGAFGLNGGLGLGGGNGSCDGATAGAGGLGGSSSFGRAEARAAWWRRWSCGRRTTGQISTGGFGEPEAILAQVVATAKTVATARNGWVSASAGQPSADFGLPAMAERIDGGSGNTGGGGSGGGGQGCFLRFWFWKWEAVAVAADKAAAARLRNRRRRIVWSLSL